MGAQPGITTRDPLAAELINATTAGICLGLSFCGKTGIEPPPIGSAGELHKLSRDWTVVMALPNMERKLLLSAEAVALPAYLPRYLDLRGRERILFRGYLLVECDEEREAELFSLRGGRGPILFDGRVARLASSDIEHLRSRESKSGYIQFNERFEHNQQLLVIEGPFKSKVVLYRGMDATQRELALFSLLGREVVKAFDRHELEALPTVTH